MSRTGKSIQTESTSVFAKGQGEGEGEEVVDTGSPFRVIKMH